MQHCRYKSTQLSCALCRDATHSASTQNPVVDGRGQLSGRTGMRLRRARVCACVWRSTGGVISWSLPAAVASDANRRPRRTRAPLRPRLARNLRHTHAFRSHRKTRCYCQPHYGRIWLSNKMPLHSTAGAALPCRDTLSLPPEKQPINIMASNIWPRLQLLSGNVLCSVSYLST